MSEWFTPLPSRGLITVSGLEALTFLQGLLTNDIAQASADRLVYACLLTPQGKFLHDMFVHHPFDDVYLLECEGGARAQDLHTRLKRYRLRRSIALTVQTEVSVYACFGVDGFGLFDPRHRGMGTRSFNRPSSERGEHTVQERAFDDPDGWDARRIGLTIPDGSRDLRVDKSTLDEGTIDQLHGVSYDKGCYIGQELTARMHYRGLGKRKLRTVRLDGAEGMDVRSRCGEYGIACVKA